MIAVKPIEFKFEYFDQTVKLLITPKEYHMHSNLQLRVFQR